MEVDNMDVDSGEEYIPRWGMMPGLVPGSIIPRERVIPVEPVIVKKTLKKSTPLEKVVTSISQTPSSQVSTIILTSSFAGKVSGVRWSLCAANTISNPTNILWAIVRVPEGRTVNTLTSSNSVYQPVEEVFAFGQMLIDPKFESVRDEGKSKASRYLNAGDRIMFLSIESGTSNGGTSLTGAVQLFQTQ